MPIRPENRARYPSDWKRISLAARERAGNKCEECGVPNGAYRVPDGAWTTNAMQAETWACVDQLRVTRIVLTVAHMDHTPENCDAKNLKALCQRCHLRYDSGHHAETRYSTMRARKAVSDLFD